MGRIPVQRRPSARRRRHAPGQVGRRRGVHRPGQGLPRGPRRRQRDGRAHRPRRHRPLLRDAHATTPACPSGPPPSSPTARAGGPTASRAGPTPTRPGCTTPAIKIAAGVDEDLMCAEGVRVLERFAEAVRGLGVDAVRDRQGRRRACGDDRRRPAAHRFGAATSPEIARARRARAAARVRVALTGILPARRARARALRRLVRDLPPLRGRARTTTKTGEWIVGHPPHRGRAAARHRRDGLRRRLPDADPPDRHDRAARAATTPSTPQPGDPGIPVRHRLARRRPRRDPPRPRHVRGLRPLRRRGGRARARGRPRHRAAGLPRPPVGRRRTPSSFTTRADGTIAYAENPPKKYQDIYPLNFDNDPAGPTPRCGGSSRCGSTTACASSASTTPTPSRSPSGSG